MDEDQPITDAPDNGDSQSPAQSTDDLLRALLAEQQAHRAEVASLREELHAQPGRNRLPVQSSTVLSPEELYENRMAEVNQHDFYCPGCGRLYDRERECTGRGEAPHPAIEVVSTDELKGEDTSKHTKAPGVLP